MSTVHGYGWTFVCLRHDSSYTRSIIFMFQCFIIIVIFSTFFLGISAVCVGVGACIACNSTGIQNTLNRMQCTMLQREQRDTSTVFFRVDFTLAPKISFFIHIRLCWYVFVLHFPHFDQNLPHFFRCIYCCATHHHTVATVVAVTLLCSPTPVTFHAQTTNLNYNYN